MIIGRFSQSPFTPEPEIDEDFSWLEDIEYLSLKDNDNLKFYAWKVSKVNANLR